MQNSPVLVTVDEACEMLRVGRTQLYKFVNEGLIAPIKIGAKGTRIAVDDLRAMPDRLRAKAAG